MKDQRNAVRRTLAVVALALCQMPVHAGVFSVTPVRIYMAPRDRAVAITVTNEGDSEVVLQADINAWSQTADGVDELAPTEDLILAPPIIKLAPNSRQVVRLALLKPADASRQLIYRMIMREVPEALAPKGGGSVQVPIALALSMPVFITPPIAKRDVKCELTRQGARELTAACRNDGNAYAQLREVSLRMGPATLAKVDGGTYILPGARKTVGLKADADVAAGAAQLHVAFDDGKTQVFEIALP